MSHRNYIPFRCLTSNILKENWLSYFLLPLLMMCEKPFPEAFRQHAGCKLLDLSPSLSANFLGWLRALQTGGPALWALSPWQPQNSLMEEPVLRPGIRLHMLATPSTF